jgi:hypothetical protein
MLPMRTVKRDSALVTSTTNTENTGDRIPTG